VAAGHSVLILHQLADSAECARLRREASAVARGRPRPNDRPWLARADVFGVGADDEAPGLVSPPEDDAVASGRVVRMHVGDIFGDESQALCDRLLLRGVRQVHRACPTLLPG
jgi:hypothetical protein